MGMSIDEAIKQLETYTIPCGKYKVAYDLAVDTMRKYQKIKQIVDKWNEGIYDDEGLSHTEVMELVSDEVYEDENID